MFDKLPCDSDAGGLELQSAKHCHRGLNKQKSSIALKTHPGISKTSENSSLYLFPWVWGLIMTALENKINAFLQVRGR